MRRKSSSACSAEPSQGWNVSSLDFPTRNYPSPNIVEMEKKRRLGVFFDAYCAHLEVRRRNSSVARVLTCNVSGSISVL
jgi:hypothetical protein